MKRTAAPGPRAAPPFGQLLGFHRDTTGFLQRLAARYGDVARFHLGRREAYLAAHPDDVRRILVDDASQFGRGRLMERARPILGDGLLTSTGELHRRQRRAVMRAMGRERSLRQAAALPEILERLDARWPDGVHDLMPAMESVALDFISAALFGAALGPELAAIRADLAHLARWAPLLLVPGLGRMQWGPLGRAHGAIRRLDRAIRSRVDGGQLDPATIVGHLAGGSGGGGACPGSAGIRDEAMGLFLAGHDTTAAALGWIWHLLATHPGDQARVQAEADRVLGSGRARPEHADGLVFTDRVVAEALRLFPPVSRIGRRSRDDYRIRDVVVPAGSTVFVSPFVTQRDGRWFAEAGRFEPDRWADTATMRRWSYFPFGVGPRSCVGEPLARVTLSLTVATMARQWAFAPAGRERVSRFLTLRLRRLPLAIARRRAAQAPAIDGVGSADVLWSHLNARPSHAPFPLRHRDAARVDRRPRPVPEAG